MFRYGGVFLLAAGTLLLEITLTRIFSIAEWYHFAFMAVGVALLGSGASGSALAMLQARRDALPPSGRGEGRPLSAALICCATLFSLTALGSHLLCNRMPLDSFRLAWERVQLFYLAGYYLALTLPFFWSGLAFALLLAQSPQLTSQLYAANLSGSGLGALGAIGVLSWRSTEQGVVAAALMGLLAALAFELAEQRRRSSWWPAAIISTLVGALLLCLILIGGPWAPLAIRMSPYKPLPQILRTAGAQLEGTWWSASSRVDIVSSPSIRSAPGLSLNFSQRLPPQRGLTVDGDNLQPLSEVLPAEAEFAGHLPVAVAYRLLNQPRVLVIEPKGGMDVLAALHHGAQQVVAVESDALVRRLLRGPYAGTLRGLFNDHRVQYYGMQPRSFLRAGSDQFDFIDFALGDAYRAVSWGAYSLSENYLYTVEAIADAYARLAPQGVLAVSRWLQLPPSEETRAWTITIAGLERAGVAHPADHLVALRSFQTILILAKRDRFTAADLAIVRRTAEEMSYDLVYLPGMQPQEANRHHILPTPAYAQAFADLLSPEQRWRFYREHSFDVRPSTNDRPFFFHYFRLAQVPAILGNFGRAWQPFGGGGYLVLMVLLAIVLVVSAILIVLPLLLRPSRRRASVTRSIGAQSLAYFTVLGLAYLLVEIPLLQLFILLLDQPTYAFALVLCVLLVASGVGSLLSGWMRLRLQPQNLVWLLAGTVVAYAFLIGWLPALLLGWPLVWRAAAALPLLAPLGILMGVPFPAGIGHLGQVAPGTIPWAWAANGCASVVSSILAAMLAMSVGFSRVLLLAAALYALAAALLGAMVHYSPTQTRELGHRTVDPTRRMST